MDIDQLSKKIKNKILDNNYINNVNIIDNTYLHLKHSSHEKNKFHLKLEISSDKLKSMNKIESNKVIYKILKDELKQHIHSLQILFI
tara:strand:+ start:374 stop:634 length:261 start_codon:yes stop_codon:yes gene_type:complete